MSNQEKIDKAQELKNEADKLEKEVADIYRDKIIKLYKEGKEDEGRVLIQEVEWYESLYYFDLIRLIRDLNIKK